MPQDARTDDVWAQSGVTPASDFFIPAEELVGWAKETGIEACFFDQNYEFDAIAALRGAGVRTIGRFVWERFSDEHVEPTKRAYDLVYSLTRAEQERYAGMGIETPYVRYGVHPEYFEVTPEPRPRGRFVFHYHAGLLGKRKPFKEVINAFTATREPELRLIVKAQIERRMKFLERAVKKDQRIELVLEDLPTDVHLQMFADADVCMAPARWEGLGLHLYEAIAFGQPIVCNDDAPMNELVDRRRQRHPRPLPPRRPRQLRHPREDRRRRRSHRGDLPARRPRSPRGALSRCPPHPRRAQLGPDDRGLRRGAPRVAKPAFRSRESLGGGRLPAYA